MSNSRVMMGLRFDKRVCGHCFARDGRLVDRFKMPTILEALTLACRKFAELTNSPASITLVRVVSAGFLCFSCLTSAHGVEDPIASTKSTEAIQACATSIPGSLTASLVCSDKAAAMRQLDEAGCFVANAPAAQEVRSVWRDRESLAADAAGRDPVVQAFMAQCLVEAFAQSHPPDPEDVSAVAYLRSKMSDSDPQIARIAMMSLGPILTQEDIDTIVGLGSTESELVMPAVMALSFPCTPSAKSGIAAIQVAYAGTAQASDIQRLVEGNTRLCGKDGPAAPMKFSGEVLVH